VEFSREHGFGIRFIEYMDVGNANSWTSAKLVSKKEIIATIQSRYPLKEIGRAQGSAPSVDYEFVDGRGDLGVIASVTEPFCASCTRARITADGKVVTCLFSELGYDVKALLRGGASDEEILEFLGAIWMKRSDRYSQERLEAMRDASYDPKKHKKIEMISLGG
jgi:cyclic pyranopterin phosphate synthase